MDAFLSHMWAVTIIGAPKKWAAQAIENLEKEPRGWYGGAVGMISMDGDINTGITIRTVHLRDGVAAYGAGATLLYDSDPASEDRECAMKATGFFRALNAEKKTDSAYVPRAEEGSGVRLLLVDNEDCFIHTLSNYARQTGAEVVTYRSGFLLELIDKLQPSLILVSPGPGRPAELRRAGTSCATPRNSRFRCSECAWVCKAWWKRSAASWACWDITCKASHQS